VTPEEIDKETEALFRKHGGALTGYLRRLGLPADLVGEVLTDALVAVADMRRRGKPLYNLRAFLFTVAHNDAVDRLAALYQELPVASAGGDVPSPALLDAHEISEDLIDAIRQLPPRQRQVIELRHVAGYSVKDTARIMGISTGTVGPATISALHNLKKIITQQNGNSGQEEETR